jgi:UDP-sulfoquinovose synthase
MKIIVLGADGYLGWPTCMRLASLGHDVFAIDNYCRRNIMSKRKLNPLTEMPTLQERAKIWKRLSTKNIKSFEVDVANYDEISRIFMDIKPDAVVHYAEQPSAPYSMENYTQAQFTLSNNIISTLNIIHAVNASNRQCHIIKLGTMGEYGTPNIDIEEGWITIEHNRRKDKFLFPRQASSLYHTSKIMDTDLLWFYCRTWGLKVTDLMQGPVYGIYSKETRSDESLLPFLSYDEIFGTVLNRFIVQAVNDIPLTVYGKGTQTRGYLNIEDTLQCVTLSLNSPPNDGELNIHNQFTETFTVNELAEKVKDSAKALGLQVKIDNITNPRVEKEEHYYNPKYENFKKLGLKPKLLSNETLIELMEYVQRHKSNIDEEIIFMNTKWN